MMTATASIEIEGVSPQQVLEYVLDLERYKDADHKIVRVSRVTGPDESGRGSASLAGKLRWGPATPDVHDFVLERWHRLTFTGAPRQPGRLIFDFTGTFDCKPTDTGTRVTHAYEFVFRRPFRFLERMHRTWLQAELDVEMQRVAQSLGPAASTLG